LDLCVDTYYKLLNSGRKISVDSFGGGRREIQECFLKNLSDSEINTLRVLVVPRFYDGLIFEYLVKAFQTGYSIVRIEDFNSLSFVKRDVNKKCYIHVLMRDELKSLMPEELKCLVDKKMVSYYEKSLAEFIYVDDIKYLLAELLYHLKASLKEDKLMIYIEQRQLSVIKKLQVSGETSYLLEQFQDLFYTNKTSLAGTEFFSVMIDMIHLSGRYTEAVQIISEYLGSFSQVEISSSEYLLSLFVRKIHHQMFYTPLKTILYEINTMLDSFKNKDSLPLQYCEILFMLGAHVFLPMGDFENAQTHLVQSIRIAKKINSSSLICRGLRKFAELLCAKGNFAPAEKICLYAIEIAHSNSLLRYELYLNCVLGEIKRLNGITNEAIRLFSEIFPIASSMGIKGWVGHVNLSLGNCYTDLGKHSLANEYYEKALIVYNEIGQKWGLINAEMMIQRLLLLSENGADINVLDKLCKELFRLGYGVVSEHIERIRNSELEAIRFEFL